MNLQELLFLCAGLALLTLGAEFLVRGAARLAAIMGMSPLMIGLTVVAYGTSAPELAVSLESALSGQADLAVGNVVGSNIFNVLVILGLSAAISPLRVARQLIWLDVPLMIGASALLLVVGLDGVINRFDGALLVGAGVFHAVFTLTKGRNESREVEAEYPNEYSAEGAGVIRRWPRQVFLIAAGIAMLVFGARWLVTGAVGIAQYVGLSELIIGLTIVAAGTSLPELATSLVASLRGERDIAVGNVVGSNIFNIVFVLGLSSLISANGIKVAPSAVTFDIPVMIAVAVACAPIFFTGHLIARWEGFVFLMYYAVYTAYLILNAREHDALPAFSAVMLEFVLPITVLTLAIAYARHAAKSASSIGG
jgi:cation:H+ antiporter